MPLSVLLLLGACERPFIEPAAPGFQILEPDVETILVEPQPTLRVAASSFRSVERVEVNGKPLTFDPSSNTWQGSLNLGLGLNVLALTASDVGGAVGSDTLFLVYMPFDYNLGPPLPEPRAGHSATLLANGNLLVVGGVAARDGAARGEAFVLPAGGNRFVALSARLNVPRTGHAATLLPDGRVLITGGSRFDALSSIADLVETVEIYDPDARRFDVVPFAGQPIRRALHTAALRTPDVLDLYAGRGDIRYTPEPRLGFRRDLRTFRLRNDSLLALNTLAGAPNIGEGIAGHAQTPVTAISPGFPGSYLLTGSFFGNTPADDVSFRMDFTQPPQILVTETPPFRVSRTRHAAVRLRNGFVALFGGWQESLADVLDESELYLLPANRYLRFPEAPRPIPRFGHTATKLPTNRILLLGGFNQSGNSLAISEYFDTALLN